MAETFRNWCGEIDAEAARAQLESALRQRKEYMDAFNFGRAVQRIQDDQKRLRFGAACAISSAVAVALLFVLIWILRG